MHAIFQKKESPLLEATIFIYLEVKDASRNKDLKKN